jgi:hypothetical protein
MPAIHSASADAPVPTSSHPHQDRDLLRKLSDFESVTGRLEAGGRAFDAYELESHAGHQVRLRLTSEDFRVVAFVVLDNSGTEPQREPFSQRVTGGGERVTGGVEAQIPITLPLTGAYRVVVTSVENEAHQRAISSGEYRMILLIDTPKSPPSGIEVSRAGDSRPIPPEESGPGSQKGARFSAWESDSP